MLSISLANNGDCEAWENYVRQKNPGQHAFSWAWKEILTEVFGHNPYYFIAREEPSPTKSTAEGESSHVMGILPLFEVKSLLFGRALISVPYLNAGGILADNTDVFQALLHKAEELGAALKVNYIELRHIQECTSASERLILRCHKVSMKLKLTREPQELFEIFDTKLRSQIRRPLKDNIMLSSWPETLENAIAIDAFYQVFSKNMRHLGTPVYPKHFFSSVQKHFSKTCRIFIAWYKEIPIACGITLGFGHTVEIPWASSLSQYNKFSPNMIIYWEAIKTACLDTYTVFDFGRSSLDSGNQRFKAQWGARPEKLHWYYKTFTGEIPDVNPHNEKYKILVQCWKHLPLAITNTLGPWLTRSLP